jgi:AsmA-like C-terminal region/AsmA family
VTTASTSPEIALEEPANTEVRPRRPGVLRGMRWIALFILVWALAQVGGSALVQYTRLRGILNARLEAAFGRRIEVGRYSLSLWGWPELEASPVLVAEDPRFGNEYFLRADSLTIRIRLTSLLAGRIELGMLSLSRPSLNLVRAADGRWNIEEWLPAPSGLEGVTPFTGAGARNPAPLRIRRIEVDSGRVNFKRGDEKLPFSFVGVTGSLEQQTPGHWQVSLDASPSRSAVVLQQAGNLHVEGQLGGTSSRLRPADLTMRWQNAAVADALRLIGGYDHGVRGQLSITLDAHTLGPTWTLGGRAEVRRLHRWDLPMRSDNPALNLQVNAEWQPEISEIDFAEAILQTPRSSVRGAGVVSWDPSRAAHNIAASQAFVITSSGVEMEDALAWIRAFHPNVSEALDLHGRITTHLTLAGWPMRPIGGSLQTTGISLEGGSLRAALRTGPGTIEFDRELARLSPMRINLGGEAGAASAEIGSLQLSGFAEEHGPIALAGKITGRTPRIENLADAVSALGWKLPGEWSVEGPASLDLLWNSPDRTSPAQLFGEIGLDGVQIRAPFLNLPVERVHGTVNLIGSAEELTVASAEAFGGQWSGTIAVPSPAEHARFSLKADRLNAEDLDRWLNPRWRQGFLGSVLPFLSSGGAEKIPSALRVSGHLSIDDFAFSRYVAQHLSGNFALDQRQITFQDADADFSGGKVSGSVKADLRESPIYKVSANFVGLNLAALAAGSPTLARQFSGSATGEIEFEMKGVGRDALVASLGCRGRAAIQSASFTAFDLFDSVRAGARRGGTSTFSEVNGAFVCHDDQIELTGVRLRAGDTSLGASGTVDFARNVDIHLQWMPRAKNQVRVGAEPPGDAASYLLRGPLFAPRIERAETTPSE